MVLMMFLDVLVLAALGWTIYTMRTLAAQIKIIREGKTELQVLLQQLNMHISNAQGSVESMKKLADDKAKILQKQVTEASTVIEELQYIHKAADNVAQRLEKLTGTAAAPMRENEAKAEAAATAASRPISKAEKELAEALAARRSKVSGE
jgi:TolA-binding protein